MKIINFIVCDDIRRETGNKLSLMGIYTESINFGSMPDQGNQWPKTKSIGILSQIKLEESENISDFKFFNIDVALNDEITQISPVAIPMSPRSHQKKILISGVFSNYKFTGPGRIQFIFKFFNNNSEEVGRVEAGESMEVKETIMPLPPTP